MMDFNSTSSISGQITVMLPLENGVLDLVENTDKE
jgi:hypothetical protein